MEGEAPICACGLRMGRVAIHLPGTPADAWRPGYVCDHCVVDPAEAPRVIEGAGMQRMPERPWRPGEEKP